MTEREDNSKGTARNDNHGYGLMGAIKGSTYTLITSY